MQLVKKYFGSIKTLNTKGFTLLEVLLVIGAVSVLATVTVIAINPSRQMAQIRDNERNTEMEQIHSALRQYYADNRVYPDAVENMANSTLVEICAQSSTDCTDKLDLDQDLTPIYLSLIPSDPLAVSPGTGYFLYKRNDGRVLVYTDQSELVDEIVVNGTADDMAYDRIPIVCSAGYVKVPGNETYGTNDFCVMKYEAKADDDGDGIGDTTFHTLDYTWPYNTNPIGSDGVTLVSSALGYPVGSINQNYSKAVCEGAGARLINNLEWMTIAKNIEGLAGNWTGGSVGNGGLYRGHSDTAPNSALEASTDDEEGYIGTGQSSGEQKRTHTLSNGEVIWDMSGNVKEWVKDKIKANEKPSRTGEMGVLDSQWREWSDIVEYGAIQFDEFLKPSNPVWNSIPQNIGQYYKGNAVGTGQYVLLRSGAFNNTNKAGLFYLDLFNSSSIALANVGFRCVVRDDYIFPDWTTDFETEATTIKIIAKFKNAMDDVIDSTSQTDNTITSFGALTGTDKWAGGVLAGNGNIYGIPQDSTSILKIDPETDTVTSFGALTGTDKWAGGVLAGNGNIYGIPQDSTSILKIDPETDTVTSFGTLTGTDKWAGGVLAGNGNIYGIPQDSTSILKIDPETDTVTSFGTLTGTDKWIGGVLAGKLIYGIPQDSTSVLKIDTETDTVTTFGSLTGTAKWAGGVLAPNGMIYAIPQDSTSILKIDPASDMITTFGSLTGTAKWAGGVLAPNGMIYGFPVNSTGLLKIDPISDTATVITFGGLSDTEKNAGGVLAPNGMAYTIPSDSTNVFKFLSPVTIDENFPLSRMFNKF